MGVATGKMAIYLFDMGQLMTHHFIFILPFFINHPFHLLHLTNPDKANVLLKILKQSLEVPCLPFQRAGPCKCWKKVKH
jgi:hypothetical protein